MVVNMSIGLGVVPSAWRTAVITPVPKCTPVDGVNAIITPVPKGTPVDGVNVVITPVPKCTPVDGIKCDNTIQYNTIHLF